MNLTRTRTVVVIAAAFALLVAAGGIVRGGSTKDVSLALGGVAFLATCYLGTFATPALLVSLALAAEVLNGNAKLLHFPIAPDRILIAAALGVIIMRFRAYQPSRSIVWRPVHALLAATAAYATMS